MTAVSRPIQTPIAPPSNGVQTPSVELAGVRCFARRSGTRVTGRVEFPYEVYGRTSVEIDYHSVRPDGSMEGGEPSAADGKARRRVELVTRWRTLCDEYPDLSATRLAERVADTARDIKCAASTLRVWARKLDTGGVAALRDGYTKPPKKVLTIDPRIATGAVLICAWWSFRIGESNRIDTKMMHVARGPLEDGYPAADVLATIDCYYAWPCDRARMPFKPFARWVKYDFLKWIYRACDANDYRRAMAYASRERTPLRGPETIRQADVPDPYRRKRDTLNKPTRTAIRNLSEPAAGDDSLSVVPGSIPPSPNALQAAKTAKWMNNLGHRGAAIGVAATINSGMPALAANKAPQTIAEALGVLEDGYRNMLLKAAQGDRDARDQAVATMPLWWERMPLERRHNIEFKVGCWRDDVRGGKRRPTDRAAARRRLDLLIGEIKSDRRGPKTLAVALRIPQ